MESAGDSGGERPLAERLDELRERFAYVIERLDLRSQIEAHPWEIVGAAALLGAWIGFEPPRVQLKEPKSIRARLAGAALSAIGAIAVRLVREAALRQVGGVARQWWEDTSRGRPPEHTDVQHEAPAEP